MLFEIILNQTVEGGGAPITFLGTNFIKKYWKLNMNANELGAELQGQTRTPRNLKISFSLSG